MRLAEVSAGAAANGLAAGSKIKKRRRRIDWTPYIFLAPSFLVMTIVLLLPIGVAIGVSFTNANVLNMSDADFVGFKNYVDFFKSDTLTQVLNATLIYIIGGVILIYVIGLFFALMVNNCTRGKAFYRTLVVLPFAVPEVVLVMIWRWMLNAQYGVLNYVLSSARVIPAEFSWFTSGWSAIAAILMMSTWKIYPLAFLMLFAGLKGIPQEEYEAATVDGAGAVQRFRYITVPGLKYVTNSLLLLTIIWKLRDFTTIWLATQGGPGNRTAMLTIFSYLNAFKFNKLGYGSAIGVISVVFALSIATIYYITIIRKTEIN